MTYELLSPLAVIRAPTIEMPILFAPPPRIISEEPSRRDALLRYCWSQIHHRTGRIGWLRNNWRRSRDGQHGRDKDRRTHLNLVYSRFHNTPPMFAIAAC
jgi:hypothetical protein